MTTWHVDVDVYTHTHLVQENINDSRLSRCFKFIIDVCKSFSFKLQNNSQI